MRNFLFLFFSLLSCGVVDGFAAAPFEIGGNGSTLIGKYISVLEETDQPLSLEQARVAYEGGEFSGTENPVLSFGIGASPRWLEFTVSNNAEEYVLQRMVIETPWLDEADIYVISNNQVVSQRKFGDALPFSNRPVKHRFFVFDHDYVPGHTQVFIRAATPDPFVLPIFFGSLEASNQRDVFNGYTYGLLYGIVIALLLYNIILFFRIRKSRYLFYVIYLALFIAANLSYTGHGFYYIWPTDIWMQRWSQPLLIMSFATSGIVFAFSFLKTRQYFPGIFYKTLLFCIFMWAMLTAFIYFEFQSAAVVIAIAFVIFFSVFTLILALLSLRRELSETLYFLIATVATLIGASLTAISVWNIIPYTELAYRAIEIGLSVDVILLSIALGEQFRIAIEEKLIAEQLARVDPLTNLYNRRAFYELTLPILHNAERYNQNLSIIMMDIDRFKMINDRYGHSTGDEVIKLTAQTLQEMLRKGDICARWGGEEFIILLPETDTSQAMQLAERLREEISAKVLEISSGPVPFTVSLGVARRTADMATFDDLIKLADANLYKAKRAGRNVVIG